MIIGLDFGTTNSIISFWDEAGKKPTIFNYAEQPYIPTAVCYDKTRPDIKVGRDAFTTWKSNLSNKEFYRFFKTILPILNNKTEWSKKGWLHEKNPYQVTKDYLENILLKSEDSVKKNGHSIEKIVISIPEVWQRQAVNNQGADELKKIITELGLDKEFVQFVSEPTAAAAYYAWKNPNPAKRKVLVCDMGGGTFDVSFCEVTGTSQIKVTAFDGNDNNSGGVQHIKQILLNAYAREKEVIDPKSDEFTIHFWELDENIKVNAQDLEDAYKGYRKDKDTAMFTINNKLPIYASDIYEAFQHISKEINIVLDKVTKQTGGQLSFDQILLVGGFSQYFLVRKTILDHFNLSEEDGKVKIIPRKETLYAIAYGATLLAAGQVEIKEFFPHSIYYKVENRKGDSINQLVVKNNIFFKPEQNILTDGEYRFIGQSIKLEGYVALNGNEDDKWAFSKQIELPSIPLTDKYQIGIRINRSNQADFIVIDKEKKEYSISLGELYKEGIYQV